MSPGSGVAPRLEARALRARDAFSFRALLAFDLAAAPQDQALRSARRSVALDGLDRTEGVPEETTRGFGGVSAGRREEGHGWTGPVVACEAQEAAHRRRHVRAENASVGMEFVHHHHRQAPPQPGPTLMGGEHGVLEEVRVRKDDVGVFAGPPLDGGFGVAVGRRDADPRIDLARESSQADQLVGGQGLRRREIENGRPVADVREAAPAPPPPAQEVQGRNPGGKRLPRAGPGCDDRVRAAVQQLRRLRLVRPQLADSTICEGILDFGRHPFGPRRPGARTRRHFDDGGDLARRRMGENMRKEIRDAIRHHLSVHHRLDERASSVGRTCAIGPTNVCRQPDKRAPSAG